MKLMDTFIRWFILLLSYRKINYGSSGVKRVGIEGTYENNSYAITQSETPNARARDDACSTIKCPPSTIEIRPTPNHK